MVGLLHSRVVEGAGNEDSRRRIRGRRRLMRMERTTVVFRWAVLIAGRESVYAFIGGVGTSTEMVGALLFDFELALTD